jgi:ATP synthase protein I
MVQALSGLSVSLLLLVAAGWPAGLSALCGTLSYLVPNALFVLRLVLSTFRPSGSGPMVFLIGNVLKIAVAVGLLWGLSRLDADWVNWLAVVAGLIATLKGYWVAVLLTGGRITKHM